LIFLLLLLLLLQAY